MKKKIHRVFIPDNADISGKKKAVMYTGYSGL